MTLAAVTPLNTYVGTGGANTYPFTFPIFLQTHIAVTIVPTIPTTTVYTLALGTDFTVAGISPNGSLALSGTITLVNNGQAWLTAGNLTTGWTITIQRTVPYSQTSSIRNQGDYYQEFLENALDLLDMQIQQLKMLLNNCIQLPFGVNPSLFNPVLPYSVLAAPGQALTINLTENGIVTSPLSSGGGGGGSSGYLVRQAFTGTVNGVNKVFNTSVAFTPTSEMVFRNGILLDSNNGDYTVTGVNQITFAVAPMLDDMPISICFLAVTPIGAAGPLTQMTLLDPTGAPHVLTVATNGDLITT